MDYDKLYQLLPKSSITWTVNDIQIWLNFIGLSNLIPKFTNASIDGSCLSELSEEDFKAELGIQSKIILKKLMTWINQGVKNYDQFLSQKNAQNSSKTLGSKYSIRNKKNQNAHLFNEEQEQQYFSQKKQNRSIQIEEEYILKEQLQLEPRKSKKREQKKQINQLIIKQCQSTLASCFSLKEHGGMIGRHSKNQIHIVDQCVSRFHAEIQFDQGEYYIKDCGSSSGTFLRITQKTRLSQGIILEMGSNQFEVNFGQSDQILLRIIEGPNIGEAVPLPNTQKINVGRKTSNQIHFPDDQHLSNIHSTLYKVEGIWYVQDLGTTNGTWLRLSAQTIKSERFLLQNGTQFKLGGNMTYECQKTNSNRKTQKQKSDKCTLCKITQKNCIFLPCKHNICCLKCAQYNQITHCTVCGSTVTDIMKIFKV